MKKNYYLKLTLFLAVTNFLTIKITNAQCANSGNIYQITYAGKNYEIIKELKSWADASQCAVERGGYLVKIDSMGEQTAIYNAILASGISSTYKPVEDGGGISYIWIGATDKNTEGTWLWDGNNDDAGENFWNGQGAAGAGGGGIVSGLYVNWGGTSKGTYQEPDNYNNNQDAAAIALSGWPYGSTSLGIASEWNDINSANTIYYIVEYDNQTAINEVEVNNNMIVYPNPSKCKFSLSYNVTSSQNSNVKIFSTDGRLILSKAFRGTNTTVVDLTGKSKGFYFLKLSVDDKIINKNICLE